MDGRALRRRVASDLPTRLLIVVNFISTACTAAYIDRDASSVRRREEIQDPTYDNR